MAHISPLNNRHQDAAASFLEFTDPEHPDQAAMVVETFGEIEAEYAAIRKGSILLDLPHRTVIRVTGADRLNFLNRMLTQELMVGGSPLPPGSVTGSFWLNRKGRIDADLNLLELGDPDEPGAQSLPHAGIYIETDILSATGLISTLESFVFSEDIVFDDLTTRTHRFALHGPSSARLLADESSPLNPALPKIETIGPGQATAIRIAEHPVIAFRNDLTGEIGIELIVTLEGATAVFDAIARHARTDYGHHNEPTKDRYRLRHAGWHAFNIARIEVGTPLFRIDFGPSNLPHESGALDSRVSFRKGCYLGQEVVARMQSLGHPKQILRCIQIDRHFNADTDQPMTGCAVLPYQDSAELSPTEKPIGGVTSSCRSPMLGDTTICLAMMKWGYHEAGTRVLVQTPQGWVTGEVLQHLRAWSKH